MRQEYTLAQLAAAVGMTERNVRAYRSRGLIQPPRMRGRVGYYGLDHVSQLRLVQALTGRGLSLQVVGQLLDKGLAKHELARLIRDDLPVGPPVAVLPGVLEEATKGGTQQVDELVELGVMTRSQTRVGADPALAALAGDLIAHGMPFDEVTRLALAGARAGAAAADEVHISLKATAHGTGFETAGTTGVPARPGTSDGAAGHVPPSGQPQGYTEAQGPLGADGPASAVDDRGPAATTTAMALELTTTAFRVALESRLSRRER